MIYNITKSKGTRSGRSAPDTFFFCIIAGIQPVLIKLLGFIYQPCRKLKYGKPTARAPVLPICKIVVELLVFLSGT